MSEKRDFTSPGWRQTTPFDLTKQENCNWFGPILVQDDSIPPGEVHFYHNGRIVGKIVGIATTSELPPGSDCPCGRYQDEPHKEWCGRV